MESPALSVISGASSIGSHGDGGLRKRINFNFAEPSNDIERWLLLAHKTSTKDDEEIGKRLHEAAMEDLKAMEKYLKKTAWMFKKY